MIRHLCNECFLICKFEGVCPCKSCLLKSMCLNSCEEAYNHWVNTSEYMRNIFIQDEDKYLGENDLQIIKIGGTYMKNLKIDEIEEINVKRLLEVLLNEPWHKHCEIIPDYMPKYPDKNTKPSVQIRFNNGKEHMPYLRYSKGPLQGYSWDIYGDDFFDVELAIYALSKAPAPVDVSPITFKLDLDK